MSTFLTTKNVYKIEKKNHNKRVVNAKKKKNCILHKLNTSTLNGERNIEQKNKLIKLMRT